MPSPLYVCMRAPEFAAQALVRLRPQLINQAVAILEGEPPLEKTCAATLQARRLGVQHGMSRTELESFPHLTVLRRSSREETHAALALLDMAARFTPRVEELPRDAALTLVLDMTGTTHLIGSPQVIGQKLFRAARELGFFVRIAASGNLHTAACLVRAPGDTLIVVPPGTERHRLQTLPIAALGLGPELADTFAAWGVRTAGELANLPPAELVARLGPQGHTLHALASGQAEHLLVPAEPALHLEEYLAFDMPVDNLESLLFVLGPMLEQLIARARARALLLASLTVQLHLERSADQTDRDRTDLSRDQQQLSPQEEAPNPVHQRTLKPALPLDDRALLLKLLQLDLQAHPAPAAIVGITVLAEPGPRPGVQSGLFSPQSPEPMRLEVTLARIAALVGEDRVGRAVLTDTHAAEAFQVARFTVDEAATSTPSRTAQRHKAPVARVAQTHRTGFAIRRLRPAARAEVSCADGRPRHLRLFSPVLPPQLTVQRSFGPWRSSGQWWSGAVWSHEQWDIDAESQDGLRLLGVLTNDRLRKHWRLEALYD